MAEEAATTQTATEQTTAAATEQTKQTTEQTTQQTTQAAPEWRASLKSDEAKEFAKNSPDVDHLVGRALEMRKQLSGSIRVPPKDAKPDSPEVQAFRKAMGVPESHDEYLKLFPAPAEGEKLDDNVVARRATWAQRFHAKNVPADVAAELIKSFGEDAAADMKAQVEADKRYAAESKSALEKKWGPDFPVNKEFADRAFVELAEKAGVDPKGLLGIETKGGQFLLDNPDLLQIFAVIGREMGEGNLGGGTLTAAETDALEQQIRDVRQQIETAQASGDSKRANELYQKEQGLIAKRSGSKPIVGAMGRAA